MSVSQGQSAASDEQPSLQKDSPTSDGSDVVVLDTDSDVTDVVSAETIGSFKSNESARLRGMQDPLVGVVCSCGSAGAVSLALLLHWP